jgi:hypothetical protein
MKEPIIELAQHRRRRTEREPLFVLFQDRVGLPHDETEFDEWAAACQELDAAGFSPEQVTIAIYVWDALGLHEHQEPTPPVILDKARVLLDVIRLERVISEEWREYER